MTKRQEAALETRKAIIEAAARLIAEKGIDAIGVEDITDAAGVSKGSFYTYFEHKEDILCEVAYPKFDSILKDAAEHESIAERLSAFLIDSMQYIYESGINLCQGWVARSSAPIDEGGKKKMEYDRSAIESILTDRYKDNTEWILDVYYGIVFRWSVSNGSIDPVSEMREFCNGPLRTMIDGKDVIAETGTAGFTIRLNSSNKQQ